MNQECGIWTKVNWRERAALKLLCVKRTLATGRKVTIKSLLYSLIKREIKAAFTKGELDPKELEMNLEDFE